MHCNGVTIKKNHQICKCDLWVNSGKYGRLHCSQLLHFLTGQLYIPCPFEFQSSVACALGNEMLIEVMWATFKEKLYEPVWDLLCLPFFFARRQAELPTGTAHSERFTKWGCYEQSHNRLMRTLVWGIRHQLLRATAILEPLHLL